MNQEDFSSVLQLAAADDPVAKERFYQLIYDDLRDVARRVLSRERNKGEMQTTALVNEMVLRFEKGNALKGMANRRVFFATAIRAMNNILVDHYRRRKKLVDSPDRIASPLDAALAWFEHQVGHDFDQLQASLKSLAADSPRQHQVVMHRFFGGLSNQQTADLLGISLSSVERDWRLARAKLLSSMGNMDHD